MSKNLNDPSDNGEEEFQFTEQDSIKQPDTVLSRSSGADSAGSNAASARRRRKWLLVLGLALVVFCFYKLYDLFTATSPRALKTPLAGEKFVPAAPQPSKMLEVPKVEDKTLSSQHQLLGNQVSSLEQTQGNLQNQIAGLSSAIEGIQNTIAMLTQKVGEVNQIAEQKNKSAEPVLTKKSTPTPKIIHRHIKHRAKFRSGHEMKSTSPVYYVKSLIQGRAWLTSGDGNTLTVSEGSNLPGYGKIEIINTDNGVVVTSSGKIINYQNNDR